MIEKKVLNAASTKRLLISAPPGAGKTELVASKVLDVVKKLHGLQKVSFISFDYDILLQNSHVGLVFLSPTFTISLPICLNFIVVVGHS